MPIKNSENAAIGITRSPINNTMRYEEINKIFKTYCLPSEVGTLNFYLHRKHILLHTMLRDYEPQPATPSL